MRKMLLIIFVNFINYASATNYYFSNSGDDSRSPSQAQNPSTPWKTLSKLNTVFKTLKPGDALLLKRGDVFSGNIIAGKSGTNNANIVVGAYGTGAQPVVTGLASLNWKSLGGSKYESQQLSLSSINLVTRNGVPLAMGRWPNDDQTRSGYNIISSHTWNGSSRTGSINSSSISGAPNFSNGAELVMRVKHFVIDRDHVTSHTKSKISFKADYAASLKYPPNDKYGYFLQNDPAFLDKQYEWWYNPKTKKVQIYSKSGTPSGIKATTENELVTVAGFSYITFDNIYFEGANITMIKISGSTGHVTVQNCTLNCSGADGIYCTNSYNSFKNNTVSNCLNNAVYSKGTNTYFGHNKISNTGTMIGMGLSGDGNYIALSIRGDNSMAEYNKITKTGYSGVYLARSSNYSTVQYNRVDSFCLLKNDGAGIYCYGRGTINHGRKILYNIVSNGGVGKAVDGADKPYTPNNRAEGIYCDQESSGLTVKNNTLINCYRGLFVNPGCNTLDLQYNTTYNNYLYEFYVNVGANSGDGKDPKMVGNVIKNNIYVATRSSTVVGYFMSQGWSMTTAGSIDNNCYARPIDDNKTMFNNGPVVTLASWKSSHPYFDKNSKKSPKSISKSSDLSISFNETSSSKTIKLSGNYVDITGKQYSNSVTLQPYTSIVLIKTGSSASRSGTSEDTAEVTIENIAAPVKGPTVVPGMSMNAYNSPLPFTISNTPVILPSAFQSTNTPGVLPIRSDRDKLVNFTMAPNPAINNVQLNFTGLQVQHKATMRIQSINGALIKQYPLTLSGSNVKVDVSSLQAGTYIINLSGNGFTSSKKFVKIE